eukprot:scaffold83053_cov17-Tisochrysis_lutea.AAC.1
MCFGATGSEWGSRVEWSGGERGGGQREGCWGRQVVMQRALFVPVHLLLRGSMVVQVVLHERSRLRGPGAPKEGRGCGCGSGAARGADVGARWG